MASQKCSLGGRFFWSRCRLDLALHFFERRLVFFFFRFFVFFFFFVVCFFLSLVCGPVLGAAPLDAVEAEDKEDEEEEEEDDEEESEESEELLLTPWIVLKAMTTE